MTIKQRKRRHTRRRAHAAGVSRAIGRPQPRPLTPSVAAAEVVAELQRENALRLLTVANLQLRCAADGIAYRAKDRKADLIAKLGGEGTSHYQPADDDDVGCQLSRMECDVYEISDALDALGYPGAINAESILERIRELGEKVARP